MKRTKLIDRNLPQYTRSEELFNSISHGLGGMFGIAALIMCLYTGRAHDLWTVISCAIYGAALIALYSTSCIYHALKKDTAKKVMQIIDHCTIYFLIAGTYTPVLFCSIRELSPTWAWVIFAIVWGCALIATIFTAIDLKKYSKFSMSCYIGMGWCILLAADTAVQSIPKEGLLLMLYGGIAYTLGAVIYGLGKNHRYMHCVFHIFVLVGSVLQFLSIYFHII